MQYSPFVDMVRIRGVVAEDLDLLLKHQLQATTRKRHFLKR